MRIGEGKARGVLLIAAGLAIAAVLWAQAQARGQRTAQEPKPATNVPQGTVTGTAEIAGVVTDAGTGKPMSGARVMVFGPPPAGVGGVPLIVMQYPCTGCKPVGPLRYRTTADPRGRYRIRVAAPGRYAVQAAANGFAQQAYQASKASGEGGIFQVRPGEQKENVDIQLPRAAVLTGRVTDKSGEAIPSAYLLLECNGLPVQGQKRWVPVTVTVADDRGIYRAFGLLPGRYRIKMRYEKGLQLSTNVPGDRGYSLFFNRYSPGSVPQSFSPLYYYPGVTEADEAKTLTLGAGEVRRGADLSVAAVTPVKPIAGSPPAPMPTGECAVSGTVTDATTGKALERAWVAWGSTRGYERPEGFETLTDAQGRFALHGLPCFYHSPLLAWKAGYVPAGFSPGQIYGVRPWWWWLPRPGSHIPPWNVEDARLELTPQGVITGRITDSQGKPEALVGVEAVGLVHPIGSSSSLSECCEAVTDEKGEYRIFGLAPDTYYVAAQFFERGKASLEPQAPIQESYLTPLARMQVQAGLYSGTDLYYPGWVKQDDARAIHLKAGETVKGIDFTGEPPEMYSISGVVRDYARYPPACCLKVSLLPTHGEPANHPRTTRAAVDPLGKFRIEDVLPGDYVVLARWRIGSIRWEAWAPLTVTHENVAGVVLEPYPGWTIGGDLKIEGVPKEGYRYLITAVPVDSPLGQTSTSLPGSGDFVLKGIFPGQYRIEVEVRGAPDDYLKAATFGSQDVRTQLLMVGMHEPKAMLHLTVSQNGAVIQGTVMNAAGEPARDAKVALVPEDQLRGADGLFRTAVTSGQGRYQIAGVAPGEYRVVAMRIGVGKPWLEQELLKKGMESGISVAVKEGEKKTVNVRETE